MKQARALLIAKKLVAPDVFHLFFYVEGEGFEYRPGQYVILTVPHHPTPLKRLYSFAGTNTDKNVFELLIKLVPEGAASEYIRNISVGDIVDISGPAGLFTQQQTLARKIFMVTGTGVAPVLSFLTSANSMAHTSILFWGLKNLTEVYMFDSLLRLKQSTPTFSFTYCLSRQASFDRIPADLLHYFRPGHIDAVWSSQIPSIDPSDEYYLCGSRTIIEDLRLLLLSKGVQKSHLFFEKY